MKNSLRKCAVIIFLIIVCFCPSSQAAPQIITNSPNLDLPISKSARSSDDAFALDLKAFFEMDNPREAAIAIREHITQRGLSIDELPESQKSQMVSDVAKGDKPRVIHLLSGIELTPEARVESQLLQYSSNRTLSASNEKITAIIQLYDKMTVKDALEILEADINIFEHISQGSFLVRVPISSLSSLEAMENVRWIGEYKPEYKYSTVPSVSRRLGAFIYPLGGDKPEYRSDLERLGIEIRNYDITAKFYDVVLDTPDLKNLLIYGGLNVL